MTTTGIALLCIITICCIGLLIAVGMLMYFLFRAWLARNRNDSELGDELVAQVKRNSALLAEMEEKQRIKREILARTQYPLTTTKPND